MQLLKIKNSTTLAELSDQVGEKNVQSILAANNLKRTPNIGREFAQVCSTINQTSPSTDAKTKMSLLNNLTTESDIFESTALQGEDGWKVTAALGTLPGMLKIPDAIDLPDSIDILGNHEPVKNRIYHEVMNSLQNTGQVDPGIFNEYVNVRTSQLANASNMLSSSDPFQCFHIPWGRISLYSSIADTTVDFPVYPEELSDERKASYTQMPSMLYQYEPWQIYQSSGPRSVTYTFKFHRDMWTGDHTDGNANSLIRFCEANCYPEYKGSAVNSPTVTLYVEGSAHISGVLTSVSTKWSGPIGHDGWYLACELELSITEVSQTALDFEAVRKKGLIG